MDHGDTDPLHATAGLSGGSCITAGGREEQSHQSESRAWPRRTSHRAEAEMNLRTLTQRASPHQHCSCTAGMPSRRGHWGKSWAQTHCVLSMEADGTRNQTWEEVGCWLCGFKNTLEKPFQRKSSLAGCLCVSFGPQECFTSNGN